MFKKVGGPEKSFLSNNKIWMAVATLVGTIVGAGILGIPYVVANTGFLYGFFIIVGLGIAFLFLNLFTGEIVLRTKKQYQLTGYAEKYLGKKGKILMTFSLLISTYGALTAYLIGEGVIFHSLVGIGAPLLYTILFFLVSFFIIHRGVKAAGRTELILITLLLSIVIVMGFLSWDNLKWGNFTILNLAKIFLPYGVVLFAFIGSPAIPEMQEILGKEKKKMKNAIIIGSVIPIVLYIVFTFFVIGIVGLEQFEVLGQNERIATVALSIYSEPILGIFANILAILTMFTSFLTLGIALVEIYEYDYKFSRRNAYLLTFSLPLFIALFNLTTFIGILGISGALAGGLEGIIITFMYWKAKKSVERTPEYKLGMHRIVGSIIIIMFALGIIYQVLTTLGLV